MKKTSSINLDTLASVMGSFKGFDEATIDEILARYEELGGFPPDVMEEAVPHFKKDLIRAALKNPNARDSRGVPLKSASIIVTDQKTKRPQRVYRQEMLLDIGECVQVCAYWKDYTNRGKQKHQYFIDLSVRLHGPEIQGLLPGLD